MRAPARGAAIIVLAFAAVTASVFAPGTAVAGSGSRLDWEDAAGTVSPSARVNNSVGLAALNFAGAADGGPKEWDTNIDLISNLDFRDRCLYQWSVFPAGGVGYANSALPYDGFDERTKALSIVRAQAMRAYPETIGTVSIEGDLIRILSDPTSSDAIDIVGIAQSDPDLQHSLEVLGRLGVRIEIGTGQHLSLLKSCEIGEAFADVEDRSGDFVPTEFETRADGSLLVHVPRRGEDSARRIAAGLSFPAAVVRDESVVEFFDN
jgi:hypothetical protein